MKKRIIDNRKKEKFMIDDEYLNGQAKMCGWQGTIVYNSLCRHANKEQESFPSIDLMAEQHGVSRPTIIKGLDRLSKNKVIEIKQHKNSKGQWVNNTYTLLDKSEWIYQKQSENRRGEHLKKTQVNKIDLDCPSKQEYKTESIRIQNQVNKIDCKETHIRKHIEGNTFSSSALRASRSDAECETPEEYGLGPTINPGGEENGKKIKCSKIFSGTQDDKIVNGTQKEEKVKGGEDKEEGRNINKVISAFIEHNPSVSYVHKKNRDAARFLLKSFGLEQTLMAVEVAISCQGETYAPVITTPHQLKEKITALKTFYVRAKKKKDIPGLGVVDYGGKKITLEDCGG